MGAGREHEDSEDGDEDTKDDDKDSEEVDLDSKEKDESNLKQESGNRTSSALLLLVSFASALVFGILYRSVDSTEARRFVTHSSQYGFVLRNIPRFRPLSYGKCEPVLLSFAPTLS